MSDTINKEQYKEVMNKLSNLKNLAEKGATAGECAAAAAALQRLLFKYNLSVEDVTQSDELTYVETYIEIGAKYASIWSRWHYDLLSAVARTNFCKMLIMRGSKRASVVGEPHNIAIVQGMYEYLAGECRRMMLRDLKTGKEDGSVGYNSDNWRYNYRAAFVTTVARRLSDQQDEDVKTYEGGVKLVLVKGQELAKALAKLFPKLKTNRSRGASYTGY